MNLQSLWRALLRNRWLILGFAVAMVALGAVLTRLQRPTYESRATLRIIPEERGLEFSPPGTSIGQIFGLGDGGDLQTSIGILQSRRIAEAVVDSLMLQVEVRRPTRPRDEVVEILHVPRTAQAARYQLTRQADGSYGVTGQNAPPVPHPDRVAVGEPFRLGEIELRLSTQLRHQPPSQIDLRVHPFQQTVRRVQERLAVVQPRSGSQLVDVRFRSPDPSLAAAVPNVAAQSFIRYQSQTSTADSRGTIDFLQEQAEAYGRQLRDAESRLQAFRERAQIVEPQTQATEHARRLAGLQAERESLRAERGALAALLQQIEARGGTPHEVSPYRELVAFPAFLSNGVVQGILQSITALENERAALLVRREARNPDVQGLTQRINELETQLYQMARNYLDGLDRRLGTLDITLARFAGEVAELPAREVELRRQMREHELLEGVYGLIQTRLKEEEIRASAGVQRVQVIDDALIADGPVAPSLPRNLFLAGVLGMLMGVGAAVLRDRVSGRIQTAEDASAAAGVPVLVTIPPATRGRRPRRVAREIPLLARTDPHSRLADSYRTLRAQVGLVNGKPEGGVLMAVGAEEEDGSGATAANLATTYAQQGVSTILVDANLRNGSLHTLFDLPPAPGLAELLAGQVSLADAVRTLPSVGGGTALHLLCAGVPQTNPADALGSEAMGTLLDQLRTTYRAVVLVAPPVNVVPDASVLAPLVDRTLLVAYRGTTRRPAFEQAAQHLNRLNIAVTGTVLNGVT